MLELLELPFDKKIGNYSFSFQASIGHGSFSNVYLGVDPDSNPVAIKVIDKKKINHEYYAGLLNNEIKAMKKLVHKNIVRLFDVLHTNNNFYIVTEFCSGGDLSKILEKKQKLPINEALKIFRDILEGFKEMNSHCIIHRDIKPPNIYISEGIYKIGDFGFAKVVNGLYEEIRTPLIGTPLYTPPQCLQEYPYSSKCDIWSLAIVLFEMVFGRTPWNAQNHLELVMKYYQQPLMFPDQPNVPSFVYDFIKRAVVINEQQRISWEELFAHQIYSSGFRLQFSNIENTVGKMPSHTDYLQKSFTKVEAKKNTSISTDNSANEQNKPSATIFSNPDQIVLLENVKKQIDFLSTKNILAPILLEKLKFLVCKHRLALAEENGNREDINSCKKQLEALFYVLSCNSTFTNECKVDPLFEGIFNTSSSEVRQIKSASISLLKLEIREINHEIHCQNENEIKFSLLNSLGVLFSYYELLEKGKMSNEFLGKTNFSLQNRLYEENL